MIDCPVACTIAYLGEAFSKRPFLQSEDLAILASKCLSRWPTTTAQYWEVARKCTPTFKTELEKAWLTPSLWYLLSDWTGRGSDMEHFKSCAHSALTSARRSELAAEVTRIAPWLEWSTDALSSWLSGDDVGLRGWTDAAVKNADPALYPALLSHFIDNPQMHTALTTKAVARLIANPALIKDTLRSSMPTFTFAGTTGSTQELLLVAAWLKTLDWSQAGYANSFSAVKSLVRGVAKAWPALMQTIASLLPATDHKSYVVESLLSRLPVAPEHQLSKAISEIAADLPIALSPVFCSRHFQPLHLLRWLNNEAYPLPVRLQWFHMYKEHIVTDPYLVRNLKELNAPIRNTVALWCFLGATLDAVARTHWRDNGINLDTRARQHNFIARHAPDMLPVLPMISTIGLSFADALLLLPATDVDRCLSLPENVAEATQAEDGTYSTPMQL